MKILNSLPLFAVMAALSGCAGMAPGTTPSAPDLAVPAHWVGAVPGVHGTVGDAWWQQFGDPVLDALIMSALAANQDVKIAAARLEQARALVDGAEADRRPRVDATAGAQRGRDSAGSPKMERTSLGLRAAWEVDLFSRGAQGISAAKADAESVRLGWQAAKIALAADVATAYFELRTLEQRLVLRREAIDVAQRQTEVSSRKFHAGMVTALDMERWTAELAQERATLAQIEGQHLVRLRQLSLLLGRSQTPDLGTSVWQAEVPGAPAAVLPGELLERRPDVQRQAHALDAALARAGVARRDVYPSVQLAWSGSRERLAERGASAVPQLAVGYGVSLSMPILDGGRIRANIAVQDARAKEAMAEYEKAMLGALVDVESRLSQWTSSGSALEEWRRVDAAGSAAAGNAARLYDAGMADMGAVLDARRTHLQARDALAQAVGARWEAAVGLRRAFAGTL